ncbi:MAG: nitrogen regulation protein NR(II) [Syntrophobacteraceae bacterium]
MASHRDLPGSFKKIPSDAILKDILESVSDAVVTIDENHKVVLCNRAAEELFGYTSDEIVGRDVTPLIPMPHQSAHRGYVDRYLETGIPIAIGEVRECSALRKDGSTVPVDISYSVSKTGPHHYFTAVIRDISKRKEVEREIRFMERLADIGKAVAQIGHEIRKPLMLIGGFARQVEGCASLEQDQKSRQKLGIIVKEVGRLEALLNGIRLLTRPHASSDKRLLALNELLLETFDLVESAFQDRNIRIQMELTPSPLTIMGDPDQLKQVFLNLLQNAVEATSGAGKIRVTSSVHAKTGRVIFEDNGCGIPEDILEKIFDPFFTTKPEGTGLGLAISRNIISDHGGSISIQSSPAQGTTITIELPLDDGQ